MVWPVTYLNAARGVQERIEHDLFHFRKNLSELVEACLVNVHSHGADGLLSAGAGAPALAAKGPAGEPGGVGFKEVGEGRGPQELGRVCYRVDTVVIAVRLAGAILDSVILLEHLNHLRDSGASHGALGLIQTLLGCALVAVWNVSENTLRSIRSINVSS